ncbi:protein GbcA [Pseudomonas sp. FDAARGOS_380]|uniref:Protein GbcA n=1 Tax=Pseudomonas lactis TaxID=1615674 RepID=A0A219AAC1_9PSED|nr:protein GbcA [Pseudomonas sp. FDAARGOS_380]KAA6194530.1 protein GbcA [Pseudomonas lactis]NMX27992.1 protein GbcA [Pseudomonas sp. WS 5406]TKK12935.1 protein GbcA [Pseudomonas fluorescens]NNA44653.1 protein GbcA [Pseudomonas lactis]
MVAILRNARTTHLPICDIHILTATSPQRQGLARRDQIGPCRPWIRSDVTPGPHSLPTKTRSLRLAQHQP